MRIQLLTYRRSQRTMQPPGRFQVIPSGRIMVIPGFVARAVEEEQVKIAQDTRLSIANRKHLLTELDLLWQAFQPVVS
jgi:hypothetical protein